MEPLATLIEKEIKIKIKVERQNCILEEDKPAMEPLATLIEKKMKIKIKVERQNCILEEEQASNETFGHLDRGEKTKM